MDARTPRAQDALEWPTYSPATRRSIGTCNAINTSLRRSARAGGSRRFRKSLERIEPTACRQSLRAREYPALSPAAARQDQGRALQAGVARRHGGTAQGDRRDREEFGSPDLREHGRRDGALR